MTAIIAMTVTFMVLMLAPMIKWAVARMVYDDSPPSVIHAITVLTEDVAPGGVVKVRMRYSKRKDCTPPEGYGEASFTLSRINMSGSHDAYSDLIYSMATRRPAINPAGENVVIEFAFPIPADIPPGWYMFGGSTDFLCRNASRLLNVKGPEFRMQVLAPA